MTTSEILAERLKRRLDKSQADLSKTLRKQATKYAFLSYRVERLEKLYNYALRRVARQTK